MTDPCAYGFTRENGSMQWFMHKDERDQKAAMYQRIQKWTSTLSPIIDLPQPELPTEPGNYVDAGGALLSLDADGWHHAGTWIGPEMLTVPLTRLVPERPQIAREQIEDILRDYHAEQEAGLVHRLLALVNGTDRD